jgi:hypothetical protein
MRRALLLFAAMLAVGLTPLTTTAQTLFPFGGSSGTDFWIAIPPNEIIPYPTTALQIHIVSAFDTEITVYDAATAKSNTYALKAGEVRILSDDRSETLWAWEIRDYEQVLLKAIRITSEKPIAVCVLNARPNTTDSYMALPVRAWGTEYVVSTYYDFNEQKAWACGFGIVAKENCAVTVSLRGTGQQSAKTSGGKSIGQTFNLNMQAGSVYFVVGDGSTRGEFDLTGTSISSSAPIGVLSFHQRTTMPNLLVDGNGRDHLVEMTPPISMLGKKYVTVDFVRSSAIAGAGGDVFRVVATQPNTRWSVKSYDLISHGQLRQNGGVLTKAGDFADLIQAVEPVQLNSGFTVWEADKPVLISQIATSSTFDGDQKHDPFMINLFPTDQAGSEFEFTLMPGPLFTTHHLNLVIQIDSTLGNRDALLKQIMYNGQPIYDHTAQIVPGLLLNEVLPGMYFARLMITNTTSIQRITAPRDVKINGYVYGYGTTETYGHPILGVRYTPYPYVDKLPPVITRLTDLSLTGGSQGPIYVRATELRNNPDPVRPEPLPTDEVESGINGVTMTDHLTNANASLQLVTSSSILPTDAYTQFDVRVNPADSTLDMDVTIRATDRVGNAGTQRFTKQGLLKMTPGSPDFGRTKLGTQGTISVVAKNQTSGPITISAIAGSKPTVFSTDALGSGPITIPSQGERTLTWKYNASEETTDYRSDFDTDEVKVTTSAGFTTLSMKGVAGRALMAPEDLNFGQVDPSAAKKCMDVYVKNDGSFPFRLDAVVVPSGTPFEFQRDDAQFLDPIEPGERRKVGVACYDPTHSNGDSVNVTFRSSDNHSDDSVAMWAGNKMATSVDDETAGRTFAVSVERSTVEVSFAGYDATSITVTDLRGNLLHTVNVGSGQNVVQINSSSWASATYVVSLICPDGAYTRMVQIVR